MITCSAIFCLYWMHWILIFPYGILTSPRNYHWIFRIIIWKWKKSLYHWHEEELVWRTTEWVPKLASCCKNSKSLETHGFNCQLINMQFIQFNFSGWKRRFFRRLGRESCFGTFPPYIFYKFFILQHLWKIRDWLLYNLISWITTGKSRVRGFKVACIPLILCTIYFICFWLT